MIARGRSQSSATADVAHRPVLLPEVIEALALRNGGIYVDGTFGAGGYSRAMLDAASCSVFGIDRDPTAIASGQKLVRDRPTGKAEGAGDQVGHRPDPSLLSGCGLHCRPIP